MVNQGRIRYAVHPSLVVLRLEGDLRVTLSKSLDKLLRALFDISVQPQPKLVVDLSDAVNIDSTMLGLLARAAINLKQSPHGNPVVICPSEDMQALVYSMALDQVFDIDASNEQGLEGMTSEFHTLTGEGENIDIAAVQSTVIDVHRLLMSLNESNRQRFKVLVAQLEQESR